MKKMIAQVIRARLLSLFKQQFSVFKQHYTYFHTLFFIDTYFQRTQTTLLKQRYQTCSKFSLTQSLHISSRHLKECFNLLITTN